MSSHAIANAILTCPGRNLPVVVHLFREGDDEPFAVVPIDEKDWVVQAPLAAQTVERDGVDAPARAGEVVLFVTVPGRPAAPAVPAVPAAELPLLVPERRYGFRNPPPAGSDGAP